MGICGVEYRIQINSPNSEVKMDFGDLKFDEKTNTTF